MGETRNLQISFLHENEHMLPILNEYIHNVFVEKEEKYQLSPLIWSFVLQYSSYMETQWVYP